jgi:hypothetical protein
MSSGLYPDFFQIERFQASPSAANQSQVYMAPVDLDVLGMVLYAGTAPASTNSMTVNISNYPTSQQGGSGTSVGAYNLWTATNVPTVTGTAHSNLTITNSATVVENIPYALNYPLPGQSPVTGYETAQSTAQGTYTAVTAPPTFYVYELSKGLVAPDNTYTDYNGVTQSASSYIHAGDVLTFVIGGTVGSAANLEMLLVCQKR